VRTDRHLAKWTFDSAQHPGREDTLRVHTERGGTMSVRELATYPATTIPRSADIVAAGHLMAEHNVGFLCVTDDHGRPVGALTDRDIVIRAVARDRLRTVTVGDVMTHHVATVSEQASVADAASVMADHQCRRVAVTDDAGRVVGVLSLDDLLRDAGHELEHVARAVRGARPAHDVLP
jgi:CBS domain-containing protein